MKIGIILVGFNMEEYVRDSLFSWTEARRTKLGGHEFVISAVSVPFLGFPNPTEDSTARTLRDELFQQKIDHLIIEPRNIPETVARGMSLTWLKGRGVDVVWQVDLDEFYTAIQILNIIDFVEGNSFTAWFRLSLKNYVFDDKTYLTEPFTPARIHRIKVGTYEARSFLADNDIAYSTVADSSPGNINPNQLSSMTIPPVIAWIKHLTWQNNDRSRRKIEYQLKGRGWPQCSFTWDDAKGGLIFNPTLPIPKTEHE